MKKLFTILILCIGSFSTAVHAQDEAEALADYKTACLAAIDNISKIGDNFTMRSMISIAKTSLDLCQTQDGMRRVMTTLRAGVTAYLQTLDTFPDGQVYTGLVGNHSFDTGDLSLWYSVGFDLSQIGLTDLTNAISNGDVSALFNAVSLNEWNEDTKAVENQGSNAVQGGDQKYYLNSSQMIMQPIIGLPAGIYSLSAKVACNPGLFKLYKAHLNVLVVQSSVVQDVIGDMAGNFSEIFNNFDMTQYMATFLQSGNLYTQSVSCKNLSTFSDGELRFIIDEGDLVIIGVNAGLIPFIGTEQFRADNVQLTGLRAADTILTPAKADLAAALQGMEMVEANYNADSDGTATQPAFSYDKTLTERYNQALLTAQDKCENDKLADVLTKDDLKNIDGIDATLKNHYNSVIQTLNSAKEAFDKQAFIAPAADETFNIVMKDNWITLLYKWTDNAVSINENMKMQFSQKPGQSVFTLAFGFERASDFYTNQLRAFVNDHHNKYYLSEKDGSIALTTDPSEAVTITAIPSYTEEGKDHLMIGDMFLGTSYTSDELVKTNEGSLLSPARTGLTVLPASEVEFTVTVPEGWDAYTLMLPFDANLPDGVTACTVTGVSTYLPYIEGEAVTSIKANTPYYIIASEGDYTFRGVSQAVLPAYGEGLLIGRHTPYTTQGSDEYKMMVDEDGFSVFRRMEGKPVAEGECYLKGDFSDDTIFVREADAATGINALPFASDYREGMDCGQWFDLQGRLVTKQSSGILIQGGRKFMRRQ